jgi:hypothetical protein
MHRPQRVCGALLAGAAVLALGACGSSNNTTSSSGANQATAAPTSAAANSSSSFCTQSASLLAQLAHLSAGLFSASPGATPDVTAYKQLLGNVVAAIDILDTTAPSEIASAFHTLRAAFDQANTQIQSATTIAQIGTATGAIAAPAVQTASTAITAYFKTSCGIGATSTP